MDCMEQMIRTEIISRIQNFSMPRYAQLPDVGLYLEQVVRYINQCLEPLGCTEITGSMVRNYVKQGLIENPVQKQYSARQLAYLIVLTTLKQVIPLEHIRVLFARQQMVYAPEVAYDYFCMEMENILYYRFGLKDTVEDIGVTHTIEKDMLRSAIVAVSHIIHLNTCFEQLAQEKS